MVQDLKLVSTEWNGVYVDGETLVIGYALADHLARINIRTARGLLSVLEASPSSFGKLGWSLEQVEAFRAELVKLLDGVLPGDALSPPKRPRVRATGGCRPANEARAEVERLQAPMVELFEERERQYQARIEELEAALRPFADDSRWYGHMDGDAVMRDCWPEARDEAKRVLASGTEGEGEQT